MACALLGASTALATLSSLHDQQMRRMGLLGSSMFVQRLDSRIVRLR